MCKPTVHQVTSRVITVLDFVQEDESLSSGLMLWYDSMTDVVFNNCCSNMQS